ncbi:O-antigen ligase family protein [Novipirellula sp. SH528]|uniref:O-antigen ligase family protein n=1 Tax=Novipirellula sp. SH528 TaxID=3454466 RepID=UPI003FA142BB
MTLFSSFGFIWLAIAFLQTLPLPQPLVRWIAPATANARHQFVGVHLQDVNDYLSSVPGMSTVEPMTTLSLVPELTEYSLSRYAIAVAAIVAAMTLFQTRRSRRFFIWTLLANSLCLSFWGIVAQATHTSDLFPGIENPFHSSSFSTFIYKNAGATALLPGLAASAVLLYWFQTESEINPFRQLPKEQPRRTNPRSITEPNTRLGALKTQGSRTQGEVRRRQPTYQRRNHWFEPVSIVLLAAVALLVAGLIVSRSRGACVAASFSAMAVIITAPRLIQLRDFIISVVFLLITAFAFIWLTDLTEVTSESVNRVNVENVSSDPRWDHWKDGAATAVSHLPLGVGLGAYGYSHLPHQSHDSMLWFRDAHNQYLEIITELGLPGLVLLILMAFILGQQSLSLYRHSISREARGWGMIGIALLAAIGFQSVIDFVIEIPANLFVFAAIAGVIMSVQRDAFSRREIQKSVRKPTDTDVKARHQPSFGAAGRYATPIQLVLMLVVLTASMSGFVRDDLSRQCRESSELPEENYQPTTEEVTHHLAALDQAIERVPNAAALYHRRFTWKFIQFRKQLIEIAASQGVPLRWEQTSPESIFTLLGIEDNPSRARLRSDIVVNAAVEETLASATRDLITSLTLNPFVPQAQLAAAFTSPLWNGDSSAFATNCRQLSRSSTDLMYANGFYGFLIQDKTIAMDQWKRYLSLTHGHQDSILRLADPWVSPREVVVDLIPDVRTDLLMQYVRSIVASASAATSSPYVDGAIQAVQMNKTITEAKRHALLAQLTSLKSDHQTASDHWKQALSLDSRNLDYRFEYANSLYRCKNYDEAQKQAILGQTLEPERGRFKPLLEKIETSSVRAYSR